MVFWPELSKILSILFEILTSDDMECDASDMPWFLLKYYEKMVEIGLKS